jgi:hypothetical protein
VVAGIVAMSVVLPGVRPNAATAQAPGLAGTSIDEASRLFYSGRYDESAAMAQTLRDADPASLAAYELRTSALHFRIKRELAGASDKKDALRKCAPCAEWLAALKTDIAAGRTRARDRLKANPNDTEALFFLGKIDLTHVWLHLETLGQRTGWGEYWEARRSLDAVLAREPDHIRAAVARAWIDYIVDTRVPRGFRWMLGGGDRKGALETARLSASAPAADVYTRAEAGFALWEMLTREKRINEATVVARDLQRELPENRALARLLKIPDA